MRQGHRRLWIGCVLMVGLSTLPARGQGQAPATLVDERAPKDLKPLLLPRQSEMRLVTIRYTMDRATLSGNYLGGARGGGGGRGGAVGTPPAESLSPNRIARLKRFDLDWRDALAKLEAGKLSAAAKTDLDALETTVQANSKQLDGEAASASASGG